MLLVFQFSAKVAKLIERRTNKKVVHELPPLNAALARAVYRGRCCANVVFLCLLDVWPVIKDGFLCFGQRTA